MGLLLDGKGRPLGGSWMYAPAGKRHVADDVEIPPVKRLRSNPYVQNARLYVEKRFPDHPGATTEFRYPINEDEARSWLDHFLEHRLLHYGEHCEMISQHRQATFHSLLSAALNVGLLSPEYVLQRVNAYIGRHPVPLASIEAFVRRMVGTREFARAVYLHDGERLKRINFFIHTKRLSPMWYGAQTGMLPLDRTLEKVVRHAYCSHSERLRILGNCMLLCEVHPDEVYRWFMEMFVDGYDWAMVPNIYALSQFADGGTIYPSPQFFSSKDVLEVSDYPKGAWCEILDGLYWRFVQRHARLLSRDSRLKEIDRKMARMAKQKRSRMRRAGKAFLERATA